MHIAIIGTRGIPNNYGGFEQCAEFLAAGLVIKGFSVTVYNSHNHPYKGKEWKGVNIIHCFDPEYKLGIVGQFIYDLNCILDSRKRGFDIILQLGYTSNSVWGWMLPRKTIITTNMDGMEWKRTKYSRPVQHFLRFAEELAVRYSDYLISDSVGIGEYLFRKYHKESVFIPYGANLCDHFDSRVLSVYGLAAYQYDMLIARLEPENSIETILDGVVKAGSKRSFLVVGNYDTKFGTYIKEKYSKNPNILFVGGIFDLNKLNDLRCSSNIYFHGHTVGGTNPSLIEAMASNCLICAHDNPFNKFILGNDALYFQSVQDVVDCLKTVQDKNYNYQHMVHNNRNKVINIYNWDRIIDRYADHFINIAKQEHWYPATHKMKPENEVHI